MRGQSGNLGFLIDPKNKNLVEDIEIWLDISSFIEFHSTISEEKSKMYQPIRGLGGNLLVSICLKNTNFDENIEI